MGIFLARNWREEISRARIEQTLGADALPVLFPNYPAAGPRTLADLCDGLDNPLAVGSASNAWTVSGAYGHKEAVAGGRPPSEV